MTPPLIPTEFPNGRASIEARPQTNRASDGPRVILLFARDRAFDQMLEEALLGSSALVLIARNVAAALQIVCQRGPELDLAVLDFDEGCRGMTLLSAVHGCYEQLPVLVTSTRDDEHVETVAYANGARACLRRPFPTPALFDASTALCAPHDQRLIAA